MKKQHKGIHHASLYIPLVIIFLMVVSLSLLHTQVKGLVNHYTSKNSTSTTSVEK
jgi:hypothetical protein